MINTGFDLTNTANSRFPMSSGAEKFELQGTFASVMDTRNSSSLSVGLNRKFDPTDAAPGVAY